MYGAAQSVTAPLVLIPGPHGRVRLAARPSTHRLLLEKREREREAHSREEMEIEMGAVR